ncbi:L-aspartate oxidase [Curtobacterium flaccumfaciens]|uniref:L-aspartate oxidase n=1 Tax=Curtobacterium flaccumfaciens TaxID=2035 RepID=UPI001BDEE2E2|nr:FAD-binding protein [Curtobacterium flaccumfaciens]MBT1605455.1 FAD-binding protein [Curtobacterium flaccumfaciens pv. betae]MBT1658433.1 FAD-binding protein [Curtobacterium flaccumfaciens pv. betae]MCS0470323.1 FAD-binding protein [Curtobacterium flaccumfaciens pv. betae]MCS0473687.1 FAD-binding protein [Curtobacterium flaccumfaciens pv. betae]MCS0478808.1 FAD-binding protein [Curtobacterium flaccumfaciens pv. betae]
MHVVIVGSGIAGLTAAIRASALHDVTLVTKGALADSATAYAQGGIAVALGADDSAALHQADTHVAAAGSADARAVEVLCTDGPARVRDLLALGVPFDRSSDPATLDRYGDDLARGREAAHGRWRVVHADGDATGAAIERTLIAALHRRHVTILERTSLTDLVVRGGVVVGVDVLDLLGEPRRLDADAVVIASGGAGHLYRETTNPLVATGDGVAAAWRAGAVLADLEFVQFHPTRLAVPGGGLVSEAVRGEGAVLRDAAGHRFMTDVHPDAELAPRDVVARGIAAAVRDQGGAPVLLDATGLDAGFLVTRFPGLTRATRAAGFDWTREGVPVAPAAHYSMGGIATDAEGRTSLPGLLAVGEAACTGVHGANRLASNSLLEGLVFAVRAADAVAAPRPGLLRLRGDAGLHVTRVPRAADAIRASPHLLGRHAAPQAPQRAGTGRRGPSPTLPGGATHLDDVGAVRQAVQSVMTDRVGLLRDAVGLASARRDLDALTAPTGGGVREHEDRALLDLARLVALAAEARTESRGAHARTDHPDTDPTAPASYAWVADHTDAHPDAHPDEHTDERADGSAAVPQEVPA